MRNKPAGDYDHNAQRRILLTCRLCLVSYSIPWLLSEQLMKLKLT